MNILVVDDHAAQRLSLAAALADLGENVVEAASGRDALRELLQREFAVILLDVNMPGLNGFETAALIRQRPSCEHTPIIFVTAYSDDAHALCGYSLGAVDYILAPVEPQVLRTKVGVLVDLFRKTEEVKRQAAAASLRAAQLHRLTEAALVIHSELSVNRMLQAVTERAAALIGARQAVTRLAMDHGGGERLFVAPAADPEGRTLALAALDPLRIDGDGLPRRMGRAECDAWTAGESGAPLPAGAVPLRGWLAAPLSGRDGGILGSIQLSDKQEGEFNEDDEAILVQLGQMASIALENILFSQEHEANRLKDEFLATLSHELRTPLQAILTWTQLLREGGLAAAAGTRGLEVIERSAKAQARLIEDLLDVSRIINNKLRVERRPVDVAKVIDATIESVRPMAVAAEVSVRRLPGPPCQVSADPNRLQQIVWNLLSNAVKFTPKAGEVDVQVEQVANRVRIRVCDTGKGIAPEFLPHIFERFRQADSSTARAHGGLGIGLFVVRNLVELHGGTVRAESAGEGKGATFTVELPMLSQHPAPSPAPRRAVEGTSQVAQWTPGLRVDGLRVVVVDDERDARDCLALALQQFGARVTAVGSAAEALATLEHPLPDVVVCDIGMPGEDGYALIRKIRARPPAHGGRVPAAAVTAYARPEDRARALAAGFDAHVAKPIDPSELARTVHTLAHGRP